LLSRLLVMASDRQIVSDFDMVMRGNDPFARRLSCGMICCSARDRRMKIHHDPDELGLVARRAAIAGLRICGPGTTLNPTTDGGRDMTPVRPQEAGAKLATVEAEDLVSRADASSASPTSGSALYAALDLERTVAGC
jgi:hypothetical protein